MKLLNYGLLAVAAISQSVALADINVQNASFSKTWQDIKVDSHGFDLQVSRTYNSRSLHDGLFGFGWSSNLETRLYHLPEGQIKILHCDCGEETKFYPADFDEKRKDQLLAQIAVKLKAEKRTTQEINQTISQLRYNDEQRIIYAKKYQLSNDDYQQQRQFTNSDYETLEYVVDGNEAKYIWHKRHNVDYMFNQQGYLTRVQDNNGNFLNYSYQDNLLTRIENAVGQYLQLSYDANQRLKKITSSKGDSSYYTFKNTNNLTKVVSADKKVHQYQYDDYYNLTKVTYPDKTSMQMAYNVKTDHLTKFKERDGCYTTYHYDFNENMPDMHYSVNLAYYCDKQLIEKTKEEFLFAVPDGRVESVLAEHIVNNQYGTTKNYYDIQKSQIKRIENNNQVIDFKYTSIGVLASKSVKNIDAKAPYSQYRVEFTYDENHPYLIQSSLISVLDGESKPYKTTKANFAYNSKGQLVFSQGFDGSKIDIGYTSDGLINALSSSEGQKLYIEYEPIFGKPSKVSLEGEGELLISYQENGHIKKVDAKSPSTAIKISSLFNSLLDKVNINQQDYYLDENLDPKSLFESNP